MTEEVSRIVNELRQHAREVTSIVADYRSTSRLQIFPLETTGRVFFQGPDRCRSETTIRGKKIITIRNGGVVHRCLLSKKEIWRYDLSDLPQSEPIHFAVADFWDPFFAVDEPTLHYEGMHDISDISTHVFFANIKNWAKHGLLDTRKGFSLRYKQKSLQFNLKLYVNSNTGILRRIVGIDKSGDQVLQADYLVQSVNIPMSETLFAMDESTARYKVLEITDIMLASLNPDAADKPPSMN